MPERKLRARIEDLPKRHPWLFVEPHIVACTAILAPYGGPPAVFDVECIDIESPPAAFSGRFALEAAWTPETTEKADRMRATVQRKPLVEMASVAIALVVADRVLRLGQLDVTDYGQRTDFRSIRRSCMLEISGTESVDELGRRHRRKVAQALGNPLGWDAYVVVCAFSDRGHQMRVSFHPGQERRNG